jgi:hypothetical protein
MNQLSQGLNNIAKALGKLIFADENYISLAASDSLKRLIENYRK